MTVRFTSQLEGDSLRIPLHWDESNPLVVTKPYILIVPSYCAGNKSLNAIPKQVIKFLNIKENRDLCQGVIGSGNRNYGDKYCLGAKQVAKKLGVPLLYMYEMMGMPGDIEKVQDIVKVLYETT